MTQTVKYEVVRQFKYGGKILKPGDEFIPGDGKWDDQLTADSSKFVRRVVVDKPVRRRKTTKGS